MTLTSHSCPREDDVLDLVAIGQWPARADAALAAHVAGCAICRDLAVAASAISEMRETLPDVRVPDASVVWYRSERRARAEATRRATRPMFAAQIAAALVALAVVAGWWSGWFGLPGLGSGVTAGLAATWAWTLETARGASEAARGASGSLAAMSLDSASPTLRWVLAGIATLAALIPVAFYVAVLADRSDSRLER